MIPVPREFEFSEEPEEESERLHGTTHPLLGERGEPHRKKTPNSTTVLSETA